MEKITINEQYDELLCPSCSNEYMHHLKVEVFSGIEDHVNTRQTIVSQHEIGTPWLPAAPNLVIDNDVTRNPSSRREGIVITFVCENCHAISELCFGQHKGVTQAFWRAGVPQQS